ncbi:MAG: DUF4097 family beta strand repeat-containing protein [Firmicutes bacterium]|nr:DUF4097 family beta strand repeat-containing protein [Bacillota bacterium]
MEQNLTFPSAQVQRVRMKLAWAQVEIVTGEEDVHQVFIAGDDESVAEMRNELDGGEIIVVQSQRAYAKEVLQRSRWLQICLRLPRGFAGDIDVDTVTGTIGAHKIAGGEIALTTVSGAIRAKGVTGERISLHTVSGAVVGDSLHARRGGFRSVSGMITLENVALDAMKVFTVSGGVKLSLLAGCRTLDLQSISGASCVAVEGPAKASMGSLSGQFVLSEEVKEAPGCLEISASTVSGNLVIKRK